MGLLFDIENMHIVGKDDVFDKYLSGTHSKRIW